MRTLVVIYSVRRSHSRRDLEQWEEQVTLAAMIKIHSLGIVLKMGKN